MKTLQPFDLHDFTCLDIFVRDVSNNMKHFVVACERSQNGDSCKELDHCKVLILDGERGFIEKIFRSHKDDLQNQRCQLLKIPRSTSSTSNAADAGNIHKDLKKLEKDHNWRHQHNPDLNAINTKAIETQITHQLSKYVVSGVNTRGRSQKRSQKCTIQAMQYLLYALPLAYSHKNMIQSWYKTGIVDKMTSKLNEHSVLLNCTKKHTQEVLYKCLEVVEAIIIASISETVTLAFRSRC